MATISANAFFPQTKFNAQNSVVLLVSFRMCTLELFYVLYALTGMPVVVSKPKNESSIAKNYLFYKKLSWLVSHHEWLRRRSRMASTPSTGHIHTNQWCSKYRHFANIDTSNDSCGPYKSTQRWANIWWKQWCHFYLWNHFLSFI